MGKKVSARDHLGNEYESITAMCNKYGVSTRLYYDRLSRGFTLEQALGIEKKERKKLYTKDELFKLYKLTEEQAETSITLGLTVPQMKLYAKGKLVIDHTGTPYASFNKMCEAYNKKPGTIRNRLKKGMNLEQALETDVKHIGG